MLEKAFFTYVTGSKYLDMAYSLARSYKRHNTAIPFYIISDSDFKLPTDLNQCISKKVVSKEIVGRGLDFKLMLPEIMPAQRSIFIDADSLIYGSIENLFNRFSGEGLNVIGTKVINGEWVDETITSVLKEFQINYMIRYCGALYYLCIGDQLKSIFEFAKKLKTTRITQSHRHNFNEEPLLSIAMSVHQVEPVIDDGQIWGDLHQFHASTDMDSVMAIKPVFNNQENYKFKFWLPYGDYSPSIVHMGGNVYRKNPWLFEYLKLLLWSKWHLKPSLASLLVDMTVKIPFQLLKTLK